MTTSAQLLATALAAFDNKSVAKPPIPKPTKMAVLLDRSLSMDARQQVTIHGANLFLRNTASLVGETSVRVSVSTFNHCLDLPMIRNRPIQEMNIVDRNHYYVDGGTALYDSIATTIRDMEAALNGENPVVVIQTDGDDHDSYHYTAADLAQLITRKRSEGWQFVFLGLGIDSYKAAKKIGVDPLSTLSYDEGNSSTAFVEAAKNVAKQIKGTATSTGFSDEQRRLVGDVFYKQAKLPPAAEDMKKIDNKDDASLKRLLK